MSFDTLAPVYRAMEWLLAGGKLHRCRCAFLDAVPPPTSILMLGEGPGRLLVEFARRFPAATITCVEKSRGMIAEARANLRRHGLSEGTAQFLEADALTWEPDGQRFDWIVTPFFLDCFRLDQLQTLIPKLAAAARPDAHWLLADFQEAPRGWRRWRSQCILKLMYAFFRVVTRLPASTLASPEEELLRAGFVLVQRREWEWGLLKSDWWHRTSDGAGQRTAREAGKLGGQEIHSLENKM